MNLPDSRGSNEKGGLAASLLFLFLALVGFQPKAVALSPASPVSTPAASAQDPVWSALLHLGARGPKVSDPAFWLSGTPGAAEAEWQRTVELFFAEPDPKRRLEAICRFPARYVWLSKTLGQSNPLDPSQVCPDLATFMTRAPAEAISVVYVTENLTSPSSMMGHVLLKLSGQRDGLPVEHALSYFTTIQGFNVPWIVAESLIIGKPGYYTLSSYRVRERAYLVEEQRNLWEFTVALSDEERRWVQMHLYELKDVPLTYFFTGHNCATLTLDLIAIVDPALAISDGPWVSPLDVVKALYKRQRVLAAQFTPSNRWAQRMLADNLSRGRVAEIVSAVRSGQPVADPEATPDDTPMILSALLEEAVAEGLRQTEAQRDEELAQRASEARERADSALGGRQLDLSRYKRPEKTPQDSQLRARWVNGDQERNALRLGFLPAARRLEDDQRQFFGQTELRLADTEIEIDAERGTLDLHELQLYSITSLMPAGPLGDAISGRFRLGFEQHLDENLEPRLVFNTAAALGYSLALTPDVLGYALIGPGVAFRREDAAVHLETEVGAVVEEGFEMKSLLALRRLDHQLNNGDPTYSLRFTQVKYLNRNLAAVVAVDHDRQAGGSRTVWSAGISAYF